MHSGFQSLSHDGSTDAGGAHGRVDGNESGWTGPPDFGLRSAWLDGALLWDTVNSTGGSAMQYDQAFSYTAVDGSTAVGLMTQISDEAGKTRQTVADGAGRLVSVVEDPSRAGYAGAAYKTAYQYDPINNLRTVKQGTSPAQQTRTFTFDSLSRLTTSTQPEITTGASNTYTDDGLLKTRMDGNGITTTWSYDALNRPVSVTRSGTGNTISPTITRCYDGLVATADFTCTSPTTAIPQAHGRLTSSRANTPAGSVVSTTTYNQYDELGRVRASQQTTNGLAPFSFSYGYDLADHIMQETYPSGRVMETAYNFAEQPTGFRVPGTDRSRNMR